MGVIGAPKVLLASVLVLLLAGCGADLEPAGERATGRVKSAALDDVCPDGQEPDGLEGCQDCIPGYFSVGGAACAPCDQGTHADVPASASCSACPDGQSTIGAGSTSLDCSNCAPGQFSNAGTGALCQECAPGQYSDPGAPACTECPQGHYSDNPASPGCTPCGDDLSTPTPGSTSAGCQACPPGETSNAASGFLCVPAVPVYNGPLSAGYVHYDVNHVLATGQSNAIASGGRPPISLTQPYTNLMFNVGVMTAAQCDGTGCRAYQTPTDFVPLVEGDNFFNVPYIVETMSSGMANAISAVATSTYFPGHPAGYTRHDVLQSMHARSGRTYWCMRKGGCYWLNPVYNKPFDEAMMQVQDARNIAAGKGLSYVVRAVTSVHGESDHYAIAAGSPNGEFPLPGTDGTPNKIRNYGDGLIEWQQDFESSIQAITGQTEPVPLLVAQMSGWTNTQRSRIPNDMLSAHERAPGKVVVVTPQYPIPFASDCLHITSDGQRRMGEYFAKAYARTVFGGTPWEPLRPIGISRAGNRITVQFHVPVPPLVLDTTRVTNPGAFGFNYADASGAATLSSIAVVGDSVQMTLSRAPAASAKLYYAQNVVPGNTCPGPTQGARGNLRDSDETPSQNGYALHNWAVHFELSVP